MRSKWQTTLIGGAALFLAAATLAACSNAAVKPTSTAPRATKTILTVAGNVTGPVTRNFNPFLPTSPLYGLAGMIYEPLVQFDSVSPSTTYPWLATSWKWSNSDKTLTFQLRKGVTWSDGRPFTSADVVYTYQLLKKFPALNALGISFSTVTANGRYEVTFTFNSPSYSNFYYLAQQYIVPKHLWSKVSNPVTFADPNPVGTGAFVLGTFQPSSVLLVRNPHYWQPGKPEIGGIRYPSYDSVTAITDAAAAGQLFWAPGPIPDVKKEWVGLDPKYNKYWYPGTGVVNLVPNVTVWPLNLAVVRKAISLAVSRPLISKLGESGNELPLTSATDLLLPNFKSNLDPAYKNATLTQNISEARRLLASAGFKMSNGVLTLKGRAVRLTLVDPSGYTDYMTDDEIIAKDLGKVGIQVTVNGLSQNTWTADLADGHFQLSTDYSAGGPLDFIYQSFLNYALSGPVGKTASGDYGRWNNSATQRYFADYSAATTAKARQKALYGLEGVMVNQVPVIPLVDAADWGDWSTKQFTGWPSPAHPFDGPSIGTPEGEVDMLHLVPRK